MKLRVFFTLVALSAHAASAFAELAIDRENRVQPPRGSVIISSSNDRISQVGVPIEPVNAIRGFGREVSIPDGIRQIVPGRWRVYMSNDIDHATRMSWRGSPEMGWVGTLDSAARSANLQALVNWNTREIMIDGADDAMRKRAYSCRIRANGNILDFLAHQSRSSIGIALSSGAKERLSGTQINTRATTLGEYFDEIAMHANLWWDIRDGVVRIYQNGDRFFMKLGAPSGEMRCAA